MRQRIEKALEEIVADPYASDLLKANLKGKRDRRVGDYRIVFAVCEECREKNYVAVNGCSDCKKHGRNDLILFDVGHRGRIYEEVARLQNLRLG